MGAYTFDRLRTSGHIVLHLERRKLRVSADGAFTDSVTPTPGMHVEIVMRALPEGQQVKWSVDKTKDGWLCSKNGEPVALTPKGFQWQVDLGEGEIVGIERHTAHTFAARAALVRQTSTERGA